MEEKEQKKYIDYHIEKNAKAFWKETPHHVKAYVKELNKFRAGVSPSFSNDFYKDTFKRLIDTGWYEKFSIVKVQIPESQCQIIYKEF